MRALVLLFYGSVFYLEGYDHSYETNQPSYQERRSLIIVNKKITSNDRTYGLSKPVSSKVQPESRAYKSTRYGIG